MKTVTLFERTRIKGSLMILFIFSFLVGAQSQYLLKQGSPPASTVYYDSGGNLGFGTIAPTARLHIRSIEFPNNPLFKLEVIPTQGGNPLCLIKNCFTENDQLYGIYQTGSVSGLLNYFQDNVKIHRTLICEDGQGSQTLTMENGVPYFKVRFYASPISYSTPLTVWNDGIKVSSKLIVDEFQLLTNPGLNKILVSDADGNGTWANASTINDYWLPECFLGKGLYLNPRYANVGIGTEHPRTRLEIANTFSDKAGVILNKVRPERDSLTNEIQFQVNGAENWALGTHVNDNHPNSFFIWNHLQGKTELFISDSGKVGFGTIDPIAKLEIVNSDDQIDMGIILNQCSDLNSKNVINFYRSGARHWTIGEDYDNGDLWDFSIRSLWQDNPSIYIQPNGMIGINTDQPHAMLDVHGTLVTTEGVGIGTHAPNDPDWKLNVNGGIWAREVKVTVEPFPDYVFSSNYPLCSISDYEKYIAENRHLPGLPSSEEVNSNGGVELGKMQVQLIEKIEEQALYIISLQKQIDELKEMILNRKSE